MREVYKLNDFKFGKLCVVVNDINACQGYDGRIPIPGCENFSYHSVCEH